MTLNEQNLTKKDLITILKDREAEFKDSKAEYEARNLELKTSIQEYVNQQNVSREARIKAENEVRRLTKELREKELIVAEQQDLKKKITEILLTYYEEEKDKSISDEDDWNFWNIEELKELTSKVDKELNEVVVKVIEKWEVDTKDRSESLDVAKEWKNLTLKVLNEEIVGKSKFLQISRDETEKEKTKNEKLQEEISDERTISEKLREELEKQKKINEELQWDSYLNNKSLPKIPSKIKELGKKIKNKFQHLIEKVKHHKEQKLVARIEVKTR